ncbi:MAG: hypothetical protein STSR0004_13940 [Peptococcaceae bacterium]
MDTDKFQKLVLEQLKTLTEGQNRLDNRMNRLDNRMNGLDSHMDKLENSMVKLELRMENEAFNKISALFDGYKLLSETLTDHTDRLQRIEDKITTHDIQIKVLDKTKSNKRKAK